MKRNSTDIINPKRGEIDIQKVYRGTSLIFERSVAEEMPIGTLEAHLKSYTNTPTYSNKWVECNGQTLSDAESPYNGQVIPNLNGFGGATKRLLRGHTSSGATGGADTNNHGHTWNQSDFILEGGGQLNQFYGTAIQNQTINILPPYYEVVWILKIK
jgi:hypothetical protein